MKLALTSVGPFYGVSTIADELERTSWMCHISMSNQLMFQYARQQYREPDFFSAFSDMLNNKNAHREELSQFALKTGFSENVDTFLPFIELDNIVIEKVRTEGQARHLVALGYTIVRIDATVQNRFEWSGLSLDAFHRVLASVPDVPLCACIPQLYISNTHKTVHEVASEILEKCAERSLK